MDTTCRGRGPGKRSRTPSHGSKPFWASVWADGSALLFEGLARKRTWGEGLGYFKDPVKEDRHWLRSLMGWCEISLIGRPSPGVRWRLGLGSMCAPDHSFHTVPRPVNYPFYLSLQCRTQITAQRDPGPCLGASSSIGKVLICCS